MTLPHFCYELFFRCKPLFLAYVQREELHKHMNPGVGITGSHLSQELGAGQGSSYY